MSTLAEIKAAVESLTPAGMREFSEWMEDYKATLYAAETLGQSYDEEEAHSPPGAQQAAGFMRQAGRKSGPPDLSQRSGYARGNEGSGRVR